MGTDSKFAFHKIVFLILSDSSPSSAARLFNEGRINFYHPLHIRGWANFELIAVNNFHCTESLWVPLHCWSNYLTIQEVEVSTDRIKILVAEAGSQKLFRRWGVRAGGESILCNPGLVWSHMFTAGPKVGFIKLLLKQAGQGQKDLKAVLVVRLQLTSTNLGGLLLVRLCSHTVNKSSQEMTGTSTSTVRATSQMLHQESICKTHNQFSPDFSQKELHSTVIRFHLMIQQATRK